MLKNYGTMHFVYEDGTYSIIPSKDVRYFSFHGVCKNVALQNWNLSDKPEHLVDQIDFYNTFASAEIILKSSVKNLAGELPHYPSPAPISVADRVHAGDITQIHFFDKEKNLITSFFVDYQAPNHNWETENINQEAWVDDNDDIHVKIGESVPVHHVDIKYHSEHSRSAAQAHPGEWCDLRTAEDVVMKQGEFKMINLGVSIKAPKNHEIHMLPRSSTFKNFGITLANSEGIIDQLYCGNNDIWYFPAIAGRDTVIPAGSRIAQFKVEKNQGLLFVHEVDNMGQKDRGGLGSTGTN